MIAITSQGAVDIAQLTVSDLPLPVYRAEWSASSGSWRLEMLTIRDVTEGTVQYRREDLLFFPPGEVPKSVRIGVDYHTKWFAPVFIEWHAALSFAVEAMRASAADLETRAHELYKEATKAKSKIAVVAGIEEERPR